MGWLLGCLFDGLFGLSAGWLVGRTAGCWGGLVGGLDVCETVDPNSSTDICVLQAQPLLVYLADAQRVWYRANSHMQRDCIHASHIPIHVPLHTHAPHIATYPYTHASRVHICVCMSHEQRCTKNYDKFGYTTNDKNECNPFPNTLLHAMWDLCCNVSMVRIRESQKTMAVCPDVCLYAYMCVRM